MGSVNVEIQYKEKGRIRATPGQRLIFSAHRCLEMNRDKEDLECLAMIEKFLITKPGLAIAGTGPFADYLLQNLPKLKARVQVVIQNDWSQTHSNFMGLPVCDLQTIPTDIQTIFIAETLTVPRQRWSRKLKSNGCEVIDTDLLQRIDPLSLPMRAWSKDPDCIYPIDIPDIEFESGKDFILIDCPARNLSLMPNGLAYVHNALKKTKLNFQTVDLDIIAYHRYHTYRLLDAKTPPVSPKGRPMHADPWLAEAYAEWSKEDTINYFQPEMEEILHKLVKARPKILGCSVQDCNIQFTRELVRRVRKVFPDIVIVVGGYSAYQPNVGLSIFPEADYMCIGEADLTVGPLLEALARGEFPQNTPGVISVFDTPNRKYQAGGMPHELDQIEMAKYDWTDLKLYRNHDHYQLTPIIATRGCRWSKCTFCGERFFWRARSPKLVVDEFEYLHDQGCDLFMFNESDLNGNPKILIEICEEIRRRKLTVRLTGQLRISRHSDRKFFDGLRAGGFTVLRFGVDAWSANTLKLQKKGYTVPMISQNLRDCVEAGIYTEVNTVLGIPGETDEDIEQTIELKGICKPHVGRVANINKLMLINGSVYWEEPEKHGIKFIGGTKEELFAKHPRYIPAELWYSENPFIDENVRVERFKRVVEGMGKLGYDMGPFALQNIERIESNKADDRLKEGSTAALFVDEDEYTRTQPEMRVDSASLKTVVSIDPPKRIFSYENEFYGVFEKNEAPAVSAAQAAVAATPDNWKGLAKPPGHKKIVHLGRSAYRLWKSQGTAMVWFNLRRRVDRLTNRWRLGIKLQDGQAQVRRDYSQLVELIDRHPAGYTIFKVRDVYYAIHRFVDFDKDMADRGGYPAGRCFIAPNARAVIAQLEQYTGFLPQHVSPQGPSQTVAM